MVYRAKITKIQGWVIWHYNLNTCNIVKDAKNVYIEVLNKNEADLLEAINKKQEEILLLKEQWELLYG